MEGITFIKAFLENPEALFERLKQTVVWDERMTARKTASYGVAYNYSQMSYPYQEMLVPLKEVCNSINKTIGFDSNNCLINYYLNGSSKMGYHRDQTDILEDGTGVVIVSLGATRILRFKNIKDSSRITNFELQSGSLIYMTQEVQDEWQHAIPKSDAANGRISLTFRRMKP